MKTLPDKHLGMVSAGWAVSEFASFESGIYVLVGAPADMSPPLRALLDALGQLESKVVTLTRSAKRT
jgi:hypothetical protein